MNGWVKYFADGSKEIGSDRDVKLKRASWSRGRLSGMTGAEIFHQNKKMAILAPGTFWQSDDYQVDVFEPTPSIVTRRLQRQIQKDDHFFMVYQDDNTLVVTPLVPDRFVEGLLDVKDQAGQWLTVEYDVKNGSFKCYVEGHMI